MEGMEAAAPDSPPTDTTSDPFNQEVNPGPDGSLNCTFMQTEGKVDPVDFCVMEEVLENQHTDGFSSSSGTYASWNYQSGNPDKNSSGVKVHDFHDDAAYGASCAAYHDWAILYASPQNFDDDLLALGPILNKELGSALPQEYDGELYFNLRKVAAGLNSNGDTSDAEKINAIADNYARQILSSFYFDLPLAELGDAGGTETGAADGGLREGGGPSDAGVGDAAVSDAGPGAIRDPGYLGDGIIGVNQQMSTGIPGILYESAKVASAAYALVDMASRYPADADNAKWQSAARKALDHIYDRAREPSTSLYYASMTTTGIGTDALGPLSTPTDLLSTDVEATTLLYVLRAQQVVSGNTMPEDAGTDDSDAGVPLDAGVVGTLKPLADFPFVARANELMAAVQFLWDGAYYDDGGVAPNPAGYTGHGGFMDGYIPSSKQVVTTKSARPNGYMLANLRLQYVAFTGPYGGTPPTKAEFAEYPVLRVLLANEEINDGGFQVMNVDAHSFFSVVLDQQAFFATVTQGFGLASATSMDPTPQSYAASAIAAVVQGFDSQLIGFNP
jgi:hypothetical protein